MAVNFASFSPSRFSGVEGFLVNFVVVVLIFCFFSVVFFLVGIKDSLNLFTVP